MKILADENVDSSIVLFLRGLGHDVFWIVENARGTDDSEIVSLAKAQQRIILTFDRDFGELVYRHKLGVLGVILLRYDPQIPTEMLVAFRTAWPQLEQNSSGHFIVVTNKKIRIRPLV